MTHLLKLACGIDMFNRAVGRTISWLALYMVLIQFIVVILRYVFGLGSIFLQEAIIYMHASLFMFGAGFTLLKDGHVRVDIFYRDASLRGKAWVDLLGSLCFLIPVVATIFYISIGYVTESWRIMEGSRETSGIHAIYLLKSVIFVFCGVMFLQSVSMIIKSLSVLSHKGS